MTAAVLSQENHRLVSVRNAQNFRVGLRAPPTTSSGRRVFLFLLHILFIHTVPVGPSSNARLVGLQWKNLDSPKCGRCANLKPPQRQCHIAEPASSNFLLIIFVKY